MALAQNWRRRGKFDEVAFIFPNAPMIPITVVWRLPARSYGGHELMKTELRHEHARMVRHCQTGSRCESPLPDPSTMSTP